MERKECDISKRGRLLNSIHLTLLIQTWLQRQCWLINPEHAEKGVKAERERGRKEVGREQSGTWPRLQEWQLLQLTAGAQLHREPKNNRIHLRYLFPLLLSLVSTLAFITRSSPPSTHAASEVCAAKFHRATYVAGFYFPPRTRAAFISAPDKQPPSSSGDHTELKVEALYTKGTQI